MGGAFSLAGHTLSSAGSPAGSAVTAMLPHVQGDQHVDAGAVQQQAEGLLAGHAPQDPAAMSHGDAVKAVGQALPDLVAGGDRAKVAQPRVVAIAAAQAHISPQDAQARLTAAEQKLTALKNQAAATRRPRRRPHSSPSPAC